MEKETVSRKMLDSMSTHELFALADKHGIVLPDDLNRRFVIGEILDAIQEFDEKEKTDDILSGDDTPIPDTLPETYNNTCIDAVLRNPAWLFAFWDIKQSDLSRFGQNPDFESFFLHISLFGSPCDEKPESAFDARIDSGARERYVLIPHDSKFIRADLVAAFSGRTGEVLASTRMIEIPAKSGAVSGMHPGMRLDFPPLVMLSGMRQILHDDYLNHRQSFSD